MQHGKLATDMQIGEWNNLFKWYNLLDISPDQPTEWLIKTASFDKRSMRYKLKTLLALITIVAFAYALIRRRIDSELLYVRSDLRIANLSELDESRIDEVFRLRKDSFYVQYVEKGITIKPTLQGVSFTIRSTRGEYLQAIKHVDQSMKAFLNQNRDLVSAGAETEVYALDKVATDTYQRRRISYKKVEKYPPNP